MPVLFSPLYYLFFLGLVMAALLAAARTDTARRVIFILSLVLVNVGALVVLMAVFLVSRLEGSTPPGLLELLNPLWLPLLLIALLDAALVILNRRAGERIRRRS